MKSISSIIQKARMIFYKEQSKTSLNILGLFQRNNSTSLSLWVCLKSELFWVPNNKFLHNKLHYWTWHLSDSNFRNIEWFDIESNKNYLLNSLDFVQWYISFLLFLQFSDSCFPNISLQLSSTRNNTLLISFLTIT